MPRITAKDIDATMRTLMRIHRDKAESMRPTPWECVVFTALTARSRDSQVEGPYQELMRKWPTPASLAKAKVGEVAHVIRAIGLYKSKAANAVAAAKMLVERYGGVVPADMDALTSLPGVGRKTASCVLTYSFGIPAIAVDTHVHRIVNRLGWVRTDAPAKTERALRTMLPQKHWLDINRVMVQFGRVTCAPGVPKCWQCPVAAYCAFPKKTPKPATIRK